MSAGRLEVAGVEPDPETSEVEERHVYSGDGETIETENAVVVVH